MEKIKLMEIQNLVKTFGRLLALKKCNLNIYKGKIMALVGENGAGKSTTVKCITGILQPSSGTIFWKGKPILFKNVNSSIKEGISVVHQELKLQKYLQVWENVFASSLITKYGIIQKKQMIKKTNEILSMLNAGFSAISVVEKLTIGNQQIVEIAKALSLNSEFIILDEPTDTLTEIETKKLFEVILKLKAKGYSFLYITHKLKEIPIICDYVTIFRDGEFIIEKPVNEISEQKIISYMVGRSIHDQFPPQVGVESKENILEVENLSFKFSKINSFSLKKGEILGFAGLIGAGRTELMKTIISEYKKTSGVIKIENKEVNITSIQKAINCGLYYVTEDRKKEGLFLDKNLIFNTTISSLDSIVKNWVISSQNEIVQTKKYIKLFNTKVQSINEKVRNLSGGNQQKVLLGKSLMTNPKILILDEPTRGIDVGARREIYDEMVKLKEKGIGIIMISSDMTELVGMSDRIAVMSDMKIKGFINNKNKKASQQEILKLAIPEGRKNNEIIDE